MKKSPSRRPRETSGGALAPLIAELAAGEGFLPSALPGVSFMRSTIHVPRSPIAYRPSIVIIAQGRKIGHLGSRTFEYDANHYLVSTVPIPFECETIGTPAKPVLGLYLTLSPSLIAELLLQMRSVAAGPLAKPQPMAVAALEPGLTDAAVRLLHCLRTEDETRILGPQIVREITFRVLAGELGDNLRALAAPQSHFGQISRVLNHIHREFAKPHDLASLAREAGMGLSTFHQRFKEITASAPLQYLKRTRLHKARLLMVNDNATAAQAALAVGYESASQFSREFKRLFGASPGADAARMRAHLITLV